MNSKPKIAVIGLKGLPAFGGAASVGEALINELKDDFDFYVYSISTHTTQKGKFNGYTQIVFSAKKINGIATLLYYLKSLLHCMFMANYDLIHIHHSESGFITPLLKLKYKIVLTTHGIFANKYDPKFNKSTNLYFRFSEKMNMIFANKIISVSKTDKENIQSYYKKECFYIPNGVNQFLVTEKEINYDFLFVAARIYEIKGLHLLLEALSSYNIVGKLLVIGDLNQNKNYQQKVTNLSKNLHVEFIPLIREKALLQKYIAKSKLFIFPSLFEAMSMTLLEVIAQKVPVLASDIEAVKNIFDETELTFFKSENVDDLAAKLIFCINNPDLISKKSKIAYQKVTTNYTWDKIAKRYDKIYQELLGN